MPLACRKCTRSQINMPKACPYISTPLTPTLNTTIVKRTILISTTSLAALVFAVNTDATVHFFSPAGAGEKDGSSWENAATAETLAATIEALQPGDEVYLRAGSYAPGLLTVPQGVTIKGGFGEQYTGTNANIIYPTANETILTADNDGDGSGDNGNKAFITMNFTGDAADFQTTTLAGLTIRDANIKGQTYKGSAFFGSNVNIDFDHIKFIDNKLDKGGGVVVLNGSEAYIHDCIWRNNQGTNAGVALHIRQKGGGTNEGVAGSNIIVDRCEFSDNTVAQPTNSDVAKYGGAIALSDNGGTMYMANSTVTGSHISWAGAGARIGGNTIFYSIHNTWFDNTCNQGARYSGAVISVGTGAKFHSMADIVVNKEEGKADSGTNSFAHIFLQAATTGFTSGGHNIWTSVTNNTSDGKLLDTDNVDMSHTVSTVFGTNEYATVNSHSKALAPLEAFRTVPLADVKAKAAEWNVPEKIDLGLDQTGGERPEITVPGAYDAQSLITTGIVPAVGIGSFAVTPLGHACFCISGACGPAEIYDLTGRKVASAAIAEGGMLDLSGLGHGIYILALDGKSAKLAI